MATNIWRLVLVVGLINSGGSAVAADGRPTPPAHDPNTPSFVAAYCRGT